MPTDKKKIKEITDIVKSHCDERFSKEYFKTTKKLIKRLEKDKNLSMDKGKVEGWVAGLFYIVGEDSGLFNRHNWIDSKEYISKTDMAEISEVSMSTMKSRAKKIREVLLPDEKFIADITYDDDYCPMDYNIDKMLKYFADILNDNISNITKKEEYETYMDKAFECEDIDEAIEYVKLALMHAKKKIPNSLFNQLKGELWLELDARPYLMVKDELASLYCMKGDYESAVEIYKEILKLNKNDNQGIRYKILPLFVLIDKYKDAEKLISRYDKDMSALLLYSTALYHYKVGNEIGAASVLKQAFKANKYVPQYLLGMIETPRMLPDMYSYGSEEEAEVYMEYAIIAWINIRGAMYWLVDEYYKYAKKNNIELPFSKQEMKNILMSNFERMKNL